MYLNNYMKTPQELEVWYIIPAIRKELAKSMQEQGNKQFEIAEKLGLTKPAVSQYLSKKRANEFIFNPLINAEIKKAAKRIKNKFDTQKEIQIILEITRNSKLTCTLHKMSDKNLIECTACFE